MSLFLKKVITKMLAIIKKLRAQKKRMTSRRDRGNEVTKQFGDLLRHSRHFSTKRSTPLTKIGQTDYYVYDDIKRIRTPQATRMLNRL